MNLSIVGTGYSHHVIRGAVALVLAASLGISGCSTSSSVIEARADTPTVAPTSTSGPVKPVSEEHLRKLKQDPYSFTIVPADPSRETPKVSLEQAILKAASPRFVRNSVGSTLEASFVHVTANQVTDEKTGKLLIVDRSCWLVIFGGKAVDVPIFGPAPDSSAVKVQDDLPAPISTPPPKTPPKGEEVSIPSTYKADWYSFVDSSTGGMFYGGSV